MGKNVKKLCCVRKQYYLCIVKRIEILTTSDFNKVFDKVIRLRFER